MNIQPPALGYRLLSLPLFLFWLAHALLHGLKHRQLNYLWQRLGFQSKGPEQAIWMHAASVGEVNMIKPLVDHYCRSHPVRITTFTASGLQHARRIMPKQVFIGVLPIDFYPVMRGFIRRQDCRLAVIAETELWPETLYQARVSQIPLILVNARLSAKTMDKPFWMKQILSRTLNYFDAHLTRTEADAAALLAMTVPESKIHICGNLKYALSAQPQDEQLPNLIGRPYILFASTRETEESLFADIAQSLQQDAEISDPAMQLVVMAPRHPRRAAQIKLDLESLQISPLQRSKGDRIDEHSRFYLADTLGELKPLMAHARLVVMGGSFAAIGGHNILEPAQLGKAVITGPSDDNIRADIDMLEQHAAIIQVQDRDELLQQLKRLLTHPDLLQRLAENARRFCRQQSHVLENYLQVINRYLKS